MTPPTQQDAIRDALACISSDLTNDEWVKVAMALKAELGDAGFDLFDDYSARGDTYDSKRVREVWKSVKAGGKVGIGTLFHIAAQHGFKLNGSRAAQPHTTGQAQGVAADRAQRRAVEEAQYRERADQAARVASQLWDSASEQGSSAYLQRKGVSGHGVRYLPDGTLLVPMRDQAGDLQNVQRIAPVKPTDGKPEKRFLSGGRKTGLMHWCGDPAGAPALLICEGAATAFTVHEATGLPVAVAFDAGNMGHVAKAIRETHPAALIVLCGDNDTDTEAKTGRNPGRLAAEKAARAVGGVAIWPAAMPGGGSDMNDLAAYAGVDAVRELVEGAVNARPPAARIAKGRSTPSPDPNGPAPVPSEGSAMARDRFKLDEAGVWFTENDQEGRPKSPQWVCSPLKVTARTRDADESSWGYLLDFTDPRGKPRQWAMPARMLAADGAEYRATLLHFGLRIAAGSRARNLLGMYVQSRAPDEIAVCTEKVGWHGKAFVLPRETLQRPPLAGEDPPERIVFQTDGTVENSFRQRGSLDQWRDRVAALCVGNSRLVFTLCCAFAGVLLRPAGMESGGFHLRGDSSGGKTTALRGAASVWGAPSYMQRWRATSNAIESIAAAHCSVTLLLDELAQVDAKEAGDIAYMLANGVSKARANRNGQARPRLTWELIFVSAGEIGLAQHMSEGGKRARAGQELRMADVPADAGAGCGIFETTHGYEGGAVFADALNKAAEACHGTAGRVWLEWAVANADSLRERTRTGVEFLAGQWVPEAASGQIHRVGRRFALVAVAGELASEAGITGWRKGEATNGVRACFEAWLASRPGGIGNSENAQMLQQVRKWLMTNQDARLTAWERDHKSERAPRTSYEAGFRKDVGGPDGQVEGRVFFVQLDVFRDEVCQGFDYRAVCRLGVEGGWLVPGSAGAFDRKERLPVLGLTRCYRVLSAIFDTAD